jgi:hypothetical protein
VYRALLLLALLGASFLPALADETPCTIPAGTRVQFHLLAPLSSNESKTGQAFAFVLLQPIEAAGCAIPVDGTKGSGTVYLAGRSGNLGHEGDLTLRIDTLQTARGRFVTFDDQRFEVNGGNRKAESSTLGLVPDAGVAAIFIHGKDIRLDTTTPIETDLLRPAGVTNGPVPAPSPAASVRPAAN